MPQQPVSSDDPPFGPPLGTAPSYSTRTTLSLALLTILAALFHGGLGTYDYPASWPAGVAYILLAGLLLVYGILLLIRYAEAHDAMSDPLPRTPMYATRHERMNHLIGLGLHLLAVGIAFAWALAYRAPLAHGLGILISLYAVWLVRRSQRGRVVPSA
ncbi:hypothetical protein [Deinococcus sp.]|uniref:hypothetical protein n=1 Tax=Deinococcus sp. TaxID=47478 RepID=UPI003C7CFB89